MNADELAAFIQKHGKGKFEDVDVIVADLQKAAKNSYRPPTVIADSVNQILAISMSTICLLQEQVKEYDKVIENSFYYSEYTDFRQRHRSCLRRRYHCRSRRHQPFSVSGFSCQIYRSCLDAASVKWIWSRRYTADSLRQTSSALLSLRSRQFSEKLRVLLKEKRKNKEKINTCSERIVML